MSCCFVLIVCNFCGIISWSSRKLVGTRGVPRRVWTPSKKFRTSARARLNLFWMGFQTLLGTPMVGTEKFWGFSASFNCFCIFSQDCCLKNFQIGVQILFHSHISNFTVKMSKLDLNLNFWGPWGILKLKILII